MSALFVEKGDIYKGMLDYLDKSKRLTEVIDGLRTVNFDDMESELVNEIDASIDSDPKYVSGMIDALNIMRKYITGGNQ